MSRLIFHLVAVLLLLYGTAVQGAVDCQKRPSFNPHDAKNCCKIPEPNWQAYASDCSKHLNILQKGPSPCLFDCIFNTTQAIQNEELIVQNVRPILSKLYSDQVFIDSYANGFQKCAPVIKQKIDEFKASGRTPRQNPNFLSQQCSPLALVYSMCAHKNVYVDCPAPAWTSTPVCENAKEYLKNCEPGPAKNGGGPRGLGNPLRGGGRRGGF